jgi:4-carboxymuconolactone decarboxylase
MQTDLYERGLEIRKTVLSPDYVENAIRNADEFGRPLQELVTTFCWGAVWGREGLDRRARSLVNLGMIAALGRMHEFKLHVGGALRNGVTRDEIQEIILQVAVYCGFPAAIDAQRAAREAITAYDASE